jgi:hypothetical protein
MKEEIKNLLERIGQYDEQLKKDAEMIILGWGDECFDRGFISGEACGYHEGSS